MNTHQQPEPRRIVARLQRNTVFDVLLWLILGITIIAALYFLKALEVAWTDPVREGVAIFEHAFHRKLPDVSLWYAVLGCCTGGLLAISVGYLREAGKLAPDVDIEISVTSLACFVVLTVVMWSLYVQAVYRDGGTFFWTIGNGAHVLQVSSIAHLHVQETGIMQDAEEIGDAMRESNLAIRGERWDEMGSREKDVLAYSASNIRRVSLVPKQAYSLRSGAAGRGGDQAT